MIFAIVVCCLGTARQIPRLRALATAPSIHRFSLRQLLTEVRQALGNASFRAIFFGMMLSTFILAVEGVLNPFMGFHFWGMTTEQLKFIPLGSLVGLLASMVIIPAATRKFDKKHTLIGSALLVILNINLPIILSLAGVSWFPAPGSSPLLYLLILSAVVTSALGVTLYATLNSMFADITDEHELEVGERREGVIFAARAFAVKATASLGLILGGILLDFIAFPRGAMMGQVDADIIWQLGFLAGPATSVFTFFGMFFYMGYRIDQARHEAITLALIKSKRGPVGQ